MKRSKSRLQRILRSGTFGVTAEVVPPRSSDRGAVAGQARALVGYADAVNVTDNPAGAVHMTPVAGCAMVAEAGLEPVVQLTCRDRNRLGLTSDLLGAWALGARSVLCLSGDATSLGGREISPTPRFFVGVADLPLAVGTDPARLERKADAGAEFVQTQIVYDVDAFGEWAESIRPRGLFERMFVLVGVAGVHVMGLGREHAVRRVIADAGLLPRPAAI